jgi:4-amino-4-deoxy-L-arabinose transferase-like glycosyltransferase
MDAPPTPAPRPLLAPRVAAAAAVAAILALHAGLLADWWKPTWDSAIYLSLARALVEGEGYRYMGHPHTLHPPGLPALLAALMAAAGTSYFLMRALMLVSGLLAAAAAYALLVPRAGRARAFLIAAVFAVSFPLLETAPYILSDLPFAALALAALAVAERAGRGGAPSGGRLAALAALLLAAVAFRTLGLVLAASVVIWGVARGARGGGGARAWAVLALAALVPAAAWLGWASQRPGVGDVPEGIPASASNLTLLTRSDARVSDAPRAGPGDYARRVKRNADYYVDLVFDALTGVPDASGAAGRLKYLLLLVPLAGFAVVLRRGAGAADVFVVLYGAVVAVWPYAYQRFILPVLPMVLLYALTGIETAARAIARGGHRSRVPAAIAGLLLAAAGLLHAAEGISLVARERRGPRADAGANGIVAASAWIEENTRPDDVVVVFQAPTVHWLTRRRALVPPWTSPPQRQLAMIEASGARWVVINPKAEGFGGYLRRLVEERPDRFEEAAAVEGARIYRVRALSDSPSATTKQAAPASSHPSSATAAHPLATRTTFSPLPANAAPSAYSMARTAAKRAAPHRAAIRAARAPSLR